MIEREECLGCTYKNWDCKNCFIDFDEKNNINVVFFLIMTRQCNFRCKYCAIDFTDDSLSYDTIDIFLSFLSLNRDKINELRIEFFGGEPLLEFEKIQYILKKSKNLNITGFSIVTNGSLLTQEKVSFLQNYGVNIILSISLHSKNLVAKIGSFSGVELHKILVNFIMEPGKELQMYDIFKKIIAVGFRKVSFIPVRYTQKWTKKNLINLNTLLSNIKIINDGLVKYNMDLSLFTGKNNDDIEKGVGKHDLEILLDWDGNMYGDYEVELYILRDFVPKQVFNFKDIHLDMLSNNKGSIIELLHKRNTIKPHYHINQIAEYLNMDESDTNLGRVMSKYNINI